MTQLQKIARDAHYARNVGLIYSCDFDIFSGFFKGMQVIHLRTLLLDEGADVFAGAKDENHITMCNSVRQ